LFGHLSKFYIFRISCQILRKFAPWMPPQCCMHHDPVRTFFSSSLVIYLHFSYENWPFGCPPGWMPGAVAPSAHPSARHWMRSFDEDVVLQLLLITWCHNAIAVEMTSSFWLEAIRFDWSSSVRQKSKMSIIYRISSIRRNRNVKIDKWTLLIEDASWPVVKISAQNVTSNRKLSKIRIRGAKDIRNSMKELVLWRRKATRPKYPNLVTHTELEVSFWTDSTQYINNY